MSVTLPPRRMSFRLRTPGRSRRSYIPTKPIPMSVFKTLVKRSRARGLTLAGVVQHQAFEGG